MATGERIRHFRKRMKMTQRYLGQLLGFPTNSADVRMAQYESEDRNPKADLTAQMASIFGVSPHAISVPDIDSYVGLMHTLFTLEDRYGLYVEESEGDVCLRVNLRENQQADELHRMLYEWQAVSNALKKGEITQEAYDQWRYNFPDGDTTRRWVKVPFPGLMDDLVAGLQENPDSDHSAEQSEAEDEQSEGLPSETRASRRE